MYTFIRNQLSVQSRSAISIHRVSRHETFQRQTSTALFPLGCVALCLVLLLCMPPGGGMALVDMLLLVLRCHLRSWPLAMIDAALFPWPLPCWPWPLFVLEVPVPLQAGPVFCLGLRWQRPDCSRQVAQLHGPRPSARCWCAPGAATTVPVKKQVWGSGYRLVTAAAEYHRGLAGLGLQLNYGTCGDGHPHAASSSSHRLSYADVYESLCGYPLEPTRR